MREYKQITCPETHQHEVVQVEKGRVSWCSRVAGRPACSGDCLPKKFTAEAPEKNTEYEEP